MPAPAYGASDQDVTRRLAGFVATLRHDRIPDAARAYVSRSLLDWLGCCIAGLHEPPVRALEAVLAPMGGAGQATVIGRGRRASVLDAALLNGVAGNVLDLDDLHPGLIGHPAAVLAPTVLALGEWLGADGAAVETAYVAGYEVLVRIGLGTEPDLYRRGWHATGVLGTFGACAAAGRLLGLDERALCAALAIAATQAAGLRELSGTPARCIHQGRAAAAGVLACLWAREGVQGVDDIVGAPHGLRVFSGEVRAEPMLDGLGERFLLDQTCYKRHAASGSLHAALDATIALRERHGLAPDQVAKVEVSTHPLALELCAPHAAPRSVASARQSMHFGIALALAEGRCDRDLYTDAMRVDPSIRALCERVTVAADPTMVYAQAMPSEVALTTRDGRRLSMRVDVPRGRPGNPMEPGELVDKFRALVDGALDAPTAQAVVRDATAAGGPAVVSLLARIARVAPPVPAAAPCAQPASDPSRC